MESTETPPAPETMPPSPSTSLDTTPSAVPPPTTTAQIVEPAPPPEQQHAPPPPGSQQQLQPPIPAPATSQTGTPQLPTSASSFPPPQPLVQSQPPLQSQLQTQPQTLILTPPQVQTRAQAQQRPPQQPRTLRPLQTSFSSPLSSPSPSLPSSSGPLQRGGMAIGVPASLHHPRATQQSPVPLSSFGNSPAFGQTFSGLPRSSVGMPNQATSAPNSQVRQPVQAIQNVGVVGGHTTATMRPGAIPGNHQQRPGQPNLRSASPSNSQSLIGQSSQPLQEPWISSQGRPTNVPALSSTSYRPQNKPQLLQQRLHQPQQQQQQQLISTTLHQPQVPASQQQQQQKLLQQSQQQQHPKQLQQTQPHQQHPNQQQQQQEQPTMPQQQQVSLPHQSLAKVQQSAHQQPQLSRSASQKTLLPALLQVGATQLSPPSPPSGIDMGESGNRILNKRTIHDLVTQIAPSERLDPEVEDILVEVAEDFVESITTFGCSLAKHRKSNTLEAKDILLHLERNWNMTIPGFGGDEIKCYKKPFTNDIHKERLSLIKKSMAGIHAASTKNSAAGQAATNSKSHAAKAPLIGSPRIT